MLLVSDWEINSSYVSLSSLLNVEFFSIKSLNKKLLILLSSLFKLLNNFLFSKLKLYFSQIFLYLFILTIIFSKT